MDYPTTTLFLLESLDGKINSGASDDLDVDKDWKEIDGVKEGLNQYYEIENTTDLVSLNTGRVMEKIGVNDQSIIPEKSPCTFVIIDNKPHLTKSGIKYLCNWVEKLILFTTNEDHPAHELIYEYDNLVVLEHEEFNLKRLLKDLKNKFDIDKITIQSGGEMNALFLKEDLIDYVHVIIAPLLVGGRETSTLIDGESIRSLGELDRLKPLELIECKQLKNSYIELKYKVRRNNQEEEVL